MKLAFSKLDIIGRAEKEEAEFSAWVSQNEERSRKYGNVLKRLAEATNLSKETRIAYTKAAESIYRIELTNIAAAVKRYTDSEIDRGADTLKALEIALEKATATYKDYSAPTDRKVTKAMLKYYIENAAREDWFEGLEDMDIESFTDELFDKSIFTSEALLKKGIQEKGYGIFKDPAYLAAQKIINKTYGLFMASQKHDNEINKARELYTAGLLEWKKGEPSYPDANFTLRLTYGSVKGYSPKDAIIYRHYTTLDGVMEKDDQESWEFAVPAKLRRLWNDKDFGDYAMADGKMPVAFLSNNDITGGNSGSPIMNAKGELIGLAFDGNWESMSSDVMFEPELQRCINVDIRYVLFIVDKFGGAGWLIDEMDIVRN